MAKAAKNETLLPRLRTRGLRKSVAELIAESRDGRRIPARAVNRAVSDLGKLVHEVEDRISGGPGKRKASAKKAAMTRKLKAQRRSAAAKKGARTRAKARS